MRIRKIFLGLLLGIFGLSVLSGIGIDLCYFAKLPKALDEKSGHTYRLVVTHGSIRYGTEREIHALKMVDDFLPIGMLFFLLAAVLGMSWGIVKVAPGRNPQKVKQTMGIFTVIFVLLVAMLTWMFVVPLVFHSR
jgi:hypothetical protein